MNDSVKLAQQLSPELRVTLNIIRVMAAVYVVVHHIAIRSDTGVFDPFLRFGQEAVMAFFLLSGFVIHANERHRIQTDKAGYVLRRTLRIYPTLLFALCISIAIAALQSELQHKFNLSEALCTLFALQDAQALKPGTICRPFLGNSPLWSLSYEIVFYLIYPLLLPLFLRKANLVQHAIGLYSLLLIVGYALSPNHWLLLPSYFIVWWGGAMMAEYHLNPEATRRCVYIPMTYLALGVLIWGIITALLGMDRIGTYPVLMLRHFLISLVFLLFALTPIASWLVVRLGQLSAVFWGWASDISYGVYVIHFPILIQWEFAQNWFGFVTALSMVVLLADIGDRRVNMAIRRIMQHVRSEDSQKCV